MMVVVVVEVGVVVTVAVAVIAAAATATEALATAAAAAAAAATSALNIDASVCYHLCTYALAANAWATNIFVSFANFQISHACLHA